MSELATLISQCAQLKAELGDVEHELMPYQGAVKTLRNRIGLTYQRCAMIDRNDRIGVLAHDQLRAEERLGLYRQCDELNRRAHPLKERKRELERMVKAFRKEIAQLQRKTQAWTGEAQVSRETVPAMTDDTL